MFNKIKVIRGCSLIAAAAAGVAALTVADTAEAGEGRWKRGRIYVAPAPMYVVAPPPVVYRPARVVYAPPMYAAPVYAPAYPVYAGPPSLSLTIPLGRPAYPVW